jgi:hypothetical protein
VAATAARRAGQGRSPPPASQAKRSAITAKPAGMTSWLQATRIPKATMPWPPHSTLTSSTEA